MAIMKSEQILAESTVSFEDAMQMSFEIEPAAPKAKKSR